LPSRKALPLFSRSSLARKVFVVVVLGLTGWAMSSGPADRAGAADVPVRRPGIVHPIPRDHWAVMLLAQGVDDSNDFERFASQHNLSFYCEEGWTPLSHGRRDTDTWWEICVVDDSGSWVIVPFLV